MDILTTLLLFLLTSFVSGGESITPPPGVVLPGSTAADAPASSLVIAIDDDSILLGTERVASIEESLAEPGLLIASLDERLKGVQRQRAEIAALKGGNADPGQPVTIQGDRRIEFQVLEKVMYTLHANGYGDIALAVLRTSKGSPS
jgi:biopolymer transport protein ExbD